LDTTEKVAAPTIDVLPKHRELDRFLDRCDSCKSQAFIVATKGDFELLFCGHHGNKNMEALIAKGWEVQDDTHLINEKPSPSANHVDEE
jgi:hypothetical protein